MVRKLGIILLALGCLLVLAGCGCEHIWLDATCQAPATCSECGKTEGELGPHKWLDATCLNPATCERCGATEGEVSDHTWQEATCQTPETCLLCSQTRGEALTHQWLVTGCTSVCQRCEEEDLTTPGHQWCDATCESPVRCSACGLEDGDPLPHQWLEADCSNPKRCADCETKEGAALGHSLEEGSDGITGLCTTCGKAVEYFIHNDKLLAWTEYEIASNKSYTNPVTYVKKKWNSDEYIPVQWFVNGVLQEYKNFEYICTIYYAEGKVYYFDSYSAENPEAVVKALCNAAKKYISFTQATYSNFNCMNPSLDGPGGWLYDTRGSSNAAMDVYGKTYAIVHKDSGTWDEPQDDDPTLTWAVSCNWMK